MKYHGTKYFYRWVLEINGEGCKKAGYSSIKNVTDVWKLQVRPTEESGSSVCKERILQHTHQRLRRKALIYSYTASCLKSHCCLVCGVIDQAEEQQHNDNLTNETVRIAHMLYHICGHVIDTARQSNGLTG
jgi:hypothetical protein